jgi:ribose/xylose/arabinose/galactoside ABC-type transport system permease subunit
LATKTEPGQLVKHGQKSPLLAVLQFIMDQRTLIILVLLCAVVGYLIPTFLTSKNLLNVMRQVSITGIVAVGMTFVIITGGIDISVGSTVALSSVMVAWALKQGYGIPASIVLALISGTAVGLLNGTLVAYGRVLPFVATLGTMYVIRGAALIVTQGEAIWDLPKPFLTIGTGYWLGIPIPVIITLVVYLLGHFLLNNFTFGRYVLGIGGDEESARLCGVGVKKIKLYTYGLCGLLTGLAGVVLAGRLGSGQPSVGVGYELTAIAAAVIGGNSLTGGRGTVLGTLVGALILGVVGNALNLWGVASFWQTVISGCIVLIAVLADTLRRHRPR